MVEVLPFPTLEVQPTEVVPITKVEPVTGKQSTALGPVIASVAVGAV
jgi:hypothetical protein